MIRFKHTLTTTAVVLAALFSTPGFAQMQMDHSKMDHSKMTGGQMDSMTDGEIRKVDKDASKITIKHGEIKNLDMPGMTMVFLAKDKSLLDKVQVGDKVKFSVISEGGKLIVTDIQAAK